ncbi:FAD-binding and (Fe-S)-binding domain-containing protein [Chitinophaga sp. 212800010-3]|uniref:FAD-binding and (Fe-S)-binding domain-containing protein n=1 Tax=unclassified Chitinophaga TaxID=2619133 RepID=UPI002DED4AF4|nr:D-lactate dehydrogenase (Cytochrome) [Chitinophaga sp. 212800010-3]
MEQSSIPQILEEIFPKERIRSRLIDLVSYASDAGFYHLVPKAVVQPVTEEEIVRLFKFSHTHQVPMVFRTGGTSLSGQAVTDGILVDLSRYWDKIEILNDGAGVKVQPGIIGARVNQYLKKYQRKIGPDPSSISAAMMGGILSNNASGMCCGVEKNSYHTTRFIRFILPDGQIFSTALKEDYDRFLVSCKDISEALINLRKQVLEQQQLYTRIREKYKTKNTVGYSLNALIDFEHPLDILAHLLIGGEGTLAFIAEAVLDTVPDPAFKATSLLYFPDIYKACKAIMPLKDAGAEMVELMDRASLRAIEDLQGISPDIKLLPETASALLVEFQESSLEALTLKVDAFLAQADTLSLLNAPAFTSDAAERDFLWKVRKGLFPAVGAVRKSGTTVVLEDVAFPLPVLGDAILDLQILFKEYDYNNAIIFGHAKDGNIHFVITQSFNTDEEIAQYDRFLKDVVRLVVSKYDGALKAEHGTGRNMAPFVETEWGGELYAVMKQIKEVIDPAGLLNPGVIINADEKAHIQHLKLLPSVEEEVDRCIECGYCEPVCPSRELTMTPRRRIVVRRVLAAMKQSNEKDYKELLKQYDYDGLQTCAVDGLCGGSCPVSINTGDLVKRLRRENHSNRANKLALLIAKRFALTEKLARFGLQMGALINKCFGKTAMLKLTKLLRKVWRGMPLWSNQLMAPPSLKVLTVAQPVASATQTIVYFPACISRVMGSAAEGKKNSMEVFMSVSAKAGIGVKVLDPLNGSCCGQIFSSKGLSQAYQYTAADITDRLWNATAEGKYPVVMDVSSCVYTLKHIRNSLPPEKQRQYDKLVFLDSVDYLHDMVTPLLKAVQKKNNIVLHPVCAVEKLGTSGKLLKLAKLFANDVTVPVHAGCCGMAGDRGFLFPELTKSATRAEAGEVGKSAYEGYYATTKTCEIALSEATGKNYESILYLVDELT